MIPAWHESEMIDSESSTSELVGENRKLETSASKGGWGNGREVKIGDG